MAKIFITFIGLGRISKNEEEMHNPGYEKVLYTMNGKNGERTRFAQRTIIENEGAATFDRVHLLMTPESKQRHRDLLVRELESIGVRSDAIFEDDSICTDMDDEGQWAWFELLLKAIHNGDDVVFDFTHGFRSLPIIFSTAISFLQKARNFSLLHVYYGYVDFKAKTGNIVDMVNFYRINEWADGVARLVDSADASKLADLASEENHGGFEALNDAKLIEALKSLTEVVKSIDVNRVAQKADDALTIISAKKAQCSGADKQLLEMVTMKFDDLAQNAPLSGLYDAPYFRTQLVLAEILIKHGLFMQAFTVMRECVASIGMLGVTGKYANKNMTSKAGRGYRRRFAEIFISLCTYPREKWMFTDTENKKPVPQQVMNDFSLILPLYERLERDGIAATLHDVASRMVKIRNGFDHAWTSDGQGVPGDVATQGKQLLAELQEVVELLNKNRYFSDLD